MLVDPQGRGVGADDQPPNNPPRPARAIEHESRVRDFVRQVWNERDYPVGKALYADTFTNPAAPGVSGAAAKTGFIGGYHLAFADLTVTIEDLVATDRVVVFRYVASGTDLGGFPGRAPTGPPVKTWAVSFLHFDGDRVTSEWVGADYLGLFEQLGILDSPWATKPARQGATDDRPQAPTPSGMTPR